MITSSQTYWPKTATPPHQVLHQFFPHHSQSQGLRLKAYLKYYSPEKIQARGRCAAQGVAHLAQACIFYS